MGFRGRHNDFLFLVSPLAVIYIPVIIDWEHAGHATLNTLRSRAVNEPSRSFTIKNLLRNHAKLVFQHGK